jgi:LysM repeat protein
MKLSRALLIVLVLHVVAVAGIIAFNTIKSRQGALPPAPATANSAKRGAAPMAPLKGETAALAAVANETALPRREETKTTPFALKSGSKGEPPKALPALPADGETGKFYVVAKGDNPVSIAKKLKVSQDELLTVNRIEDPTKLQIGQKLIVPASKKTKPKPEAN